jgi:hypothetical protein
LHCVRCGGEIPEGGQACPGCGLKLRPTPPPPIQQVMPPPPPGQQTPRPQPPQGQATEPPQYPAPPPPQYQAPPAFQSPDAGKPRFGLQGESQQPAAAPPEYQHQGTPPEPVEIARASPPQGQPFAPGDASAPQPPAPYLSPGEMPPPGQYPYGQPPPPTYGQPGKDKQPRSGGDQRLVIILVVAILIILGAVAGLYFTLKKKAPTPAEAAVMKLFDTLPSGNADAIKALYAPDAQPTAAQLNSLSQQMASAPGAKIEDVKLKTLTQNPTDATIQILDYTVTVNAGGQNVKMQMSKILSGVKFVIQVKMVNGQWLLVAPNGSVPNV